MIMILTMTMIHMLMVNDNDNDNDNDTDNDNDNGKDNDTYEHLQLMLKSDLRMPPASWCIMMWICLNWWCEISFIPVDVKVLIWSEWC